MHDLSDIAEHILTSHSLEEKLRLAPRPEEVCDLQSKTSRHLPILPGRPTELRLRDDGVRPDFPAINELDQPKQRGVMLHFLCNHELLATELMALVLLKFPDAPKAFRMGVYKTLREEQAHTLMYLRRMKECGLEFGQLPVNSYFWKVISPMASPMDFVAQLSLTFEQANLDFSKHYAKLFRQVGDTGTAAVLEKIYQDEIGHVGHGLHWFQQWKNPEDSDWEAFRKTLSFPLNPVRAKGMAPFNAEGRREAGLDEDFILNLKVAEQSRGRPPTLHWMNPLAESHAAANAGECRFSPSAAETALHDDLQVLSWTLAKKDDAIIVKKTPSLEFLDQLQSAGFDLPEFTTAGDLQDRRIGCLKPWAWTPDAHEVAETFKAQLPKRSEFQAPAPWPNEVFSQRLGYQLNQKLNWHETAPKLVRNEIELDAAMAAITNPVLKALWASAGRGIQRVSTSLPWRPWALRQLRDQGGLLIEPWREVVAQFSALYDVSPGSPPHHIAFTHLVTDRNGRYQGTKITPKWANGLSDPSYARFLFTEAGCKSLYQQTIPKLLRVDLPPDFRGALAIDAFLYLDEEGSLALKPVVEVNARCTMGRVAHELFRRSASKNPGIFQIHTLRSVKKLGYSNFADWTASFKVPKLENGRFLSGKIPITDPRQCRQFIATWSQNSNLS